MNQNKKEAHPDTAMSGRARMEAGTEQTTTSTSNDTTPTPPPQAVKVSDFLSRGEAHALPLKHLKELLHLDGRKIRLMIRAERLHGTPICENSQSGYYLPSSTGERDLCAKRLRHRAAQIIKVADAIAAADCIEGADI